MSELGFAVRQISLVIAFLILTNLLLSGSSIKNRFWPNGGQKQTDFIYGQSRRFAVPDLGYNKSGPWLIVATPGIVDFSNPQQPNYLILTPQPSATIEPTITLTSTPSPTETSTLASIILASPTAPITTTKTKEPGQQVAPIEISPTLTLVPTSSNSIESYRVFELGGIAVIVLGGLFGLFLFRRRHSA